MTLAKPRSGGAFLFRQRKTEAGNGLQTASKLDIRPQNHEAR